MGKNFLLHICLACFPSLAWCLGGAPLPACTNDLPCDAVDLGVLSGGSVLGDLLGGRFDNTCGTNLNEPNPTSGNGWFNQSGVWFRFSTGPNPGPLVFIDGRSDPQGTGDGLDLQLALYRSVSGNCNGPFRLEASVSDPTSLDGQLPIFCPRPNTTYFILVDGEPDGNGGDRGNFGLQVREVMVEEGSDGACQAENLGQVPVGDTIRTAGARSNFCSTSFGDPVISKFATQVTVWFQFQAPPSGRVVIEALTAGTEYPLGVQLALLSSPGGRCTGPFTEVASAFTSEDADERLEAGCLFPGQTYWILIDGFGAGGRGMFNLRLSDPGEVVPVTRLDTTICAGDSLLVGNSVYRLSGSYADTIPLNGSCDSIVLTTLRVLEPIQVSTLEIAPAVFQGSPGTAEAGAVGGIGPYQFQWCNGVNGVRNASLPAAASCRVTAVDSLGCRGETTFTMGFITRIQAQVRTEATRCFGESNGAIGFFATNGIAPYRYSWEQVAGPAKGEGTLGADGVPAVLPNLPAGDYQFRISDNFGDTTFVISIAQPQRLMLDLRDRQDASCAGLCDGSISLSSTGGTGPVGYRWSNGAELGQIGGLCAGSYSVTATDANGCRSTGNFAIQQPQPFIATAKESRPVSCFNGSDGELTVSSNGRPGAFRWSSGGTTDVEGGLAAGTYQVTVTNEDGCLDTAVVQLSQPAQPLRLQVENQTPVSCLGNCDGLLTVQAAGGTMPYSYRWSTGEISRRRNNLCIGEYTVTASDARGCLVTAQIPIDNPPALVATATVLRPVSCFGGRNGRVGVTANQEIARVRWSNGRDSSTISGLAAGRYQVTVTNIFGCTTTTEVEVPQPTAPAGVQIETLSPVSCFGRCDGQIQAVTIGGTGPYSLTWGDGRSGMLRTGLCSGSYSVFAVDANGCAAQASFQLNQPEEFVASTLMLEPVSCFGGSDGRVEVTANGQPVAYSWNNGRQSAILEGLSTGLYTVTVTNIDGCQATLQVRIEQPAAPLAVSIREVLPISCQGASDGRLEALISGPYETLQTVWSNGITPVNPERLGAGIYSVEITSEKGCTARRQYLLADPQPLRAEVATRNITCLDAENAGQIRIERTIGGRPDYEYSLGDRPFQQLPVFSGLRAGSYSVQVRDRSGCLTQIEASVQGPPELWVDLGPDRLIYLGDTIRLQATSNSQSLVYRWEPEEGIAPAEQAMLELRPLQSLGVRVWVEDTVTFCTATDVVLLNVNRERKVFIPNAFSPNGDGKNDRFTIFGGQGIQHIRSLRIFSRNGSMVYEIRDLMPGDEAGGWDGRFKGQDLLPGVYVYMAEIEFIDGQVELFRGDVSLFR